VGLALWTSIELANNISGYRGGVASVGRIMSMAPLAEPPAVETPLRRRSVADVRWHRVVHGALLLVMVAAALLLWASVLSWSFVLVGGATPDAARGWANLGLAAFVGMGFMLTLGGLWFGYWMRQEVLQATHLILICLGICCAVLVNLPA
jgi:hypothetical protein